MAFLIAGGITSAWTASPVFALFRVPVFLVYIVMAIVGREPRPPSPTPIAEIPLPRAPLARVIAQVRFRPILAIRDPDKVAVFQEALREIYPHLGMDQAARIEFTAGQIPNVHQDLILVGPEDTGRGDSGGVIDHRPPTGTVDVRLSGQTGRRSVRERGRASGSPVFSVPAKTPERPGPSTVA